MRGQNTFTHPHPARHEFKAWKMMASLAGKQAPKAFTHPYPAPRRKGSKYEILGVEILSRTQPVGPSSRGVEGRKVRSLDTIGIL